MKRKFLQYIYLVLFLTGALGLLGAMEIEFIGGIDNLTFPPQSKTEYGINNEKLQAHSYGLFNLSVRGDISGNLAYDIRFERDNILQNSITGTFITRTDHFRLEFGLFTGISDNFDIPEAGITGDIEFTLPGTGYLSLYGSSTLGAHVDFTTNNRRETVGVRIGYWLLDNFILSASAGTKSFSRYIDQSLTIRDQLTRYQFSVEYYEKNAPYTVRFDAGFETLSRTYLRETIVNTDELNAFFAGVELNWQITHPIRIKAGIEMPLITTPVAPLEMAPRLVGLFKAYAGLTYSFF